MREQYIITINNLIIMNNFMINKCNHGFYFINNYISYFNILAKIKILYMCKFFSPLLLLSIFFSLSHLPLSSFFCLLLISFPSFSFLFLSGYPAIFSYFHSHFPILLFFFFSSSMKLSFSYPDSMSPFFFFPPPPHWQGVI